MTLIEAIKKVTKDGQRISREYHVDGAGTFTKSTTVLISKETGRKFINVKWGGVVLLEDLTSNNWDIEL